MKEIFGVLFVLAVLVCNVQGYWNPVGEPMVNRIEPVPRLVDSRIVGGEDAAINEFPYQVALLFRDFSQYRFYCGGSILDSRSVLTAAHCLDRLNPNEIYVGAGILDFSEWNGNWQIIGVSTMQVHALYDAETFVNDIAIVYLDKPLQFTPFVQPTRLPPVLSDTSEGTLCTVTGWGALREDGQSSNKLQKVDVAIMTDEDCSWSYANQIIAPSAICASKAGKDSCQGDSGGPMYCGGEQVGVVSWGYGCARPNYPGVYTQVSHYVNWINANKYYAQD